MKWYYPLLTALWLLAIPFYAILLLGADILRAAQPHFYETLFTRRGARSRSDGARTNRGLHHGHKTLFYLLAGGLAGLFALPHAAYAAIAFDQITETNTAASSYTVTVGSGSNRFLVAFITTSSATHCTATYAGVSMTFGNIARFGQSQSNWTQSMTLMNPASGANTLAISTCTQAFSSAAISYTGVKQTGQPEQALASSTVIVNENHIQQSVTTSVANDWIVAGFGNNAGIPTSYTNLTGRSTKGDGTDVADSNGPVALGTAVYAANNTSANNPWSMVTVVMQPAADNFNFWQFFDFGMLAPQPAAFARRRRLINS